MSPKQYEEMRDDPEVRRFAFLSGYPARNDDEEKEVTDLLVKLKLRDMDPGWEIVPREKPTA